MRPVKHDKTGKIYLCVEEIKDDISSKWKVLYYDLNGNKHVIDKEEFWMTFSSVDSSDVHHIDRKKIVEKVNHSDSKKIVEKINLIKIVCNTFPSMNAENIEKKLQEEIKKLNAYKIVYVKKINSTSPLSIKYAEEAYYSEELYEVKYTVLEENTK
jgi:hypothetical protein